MEKVIEEWKCSPTNPVNDMGHKCFYQVKPPVNSSQVKPPANSSQVKPPANSSQVK
jgi:hypothetical protein